jgi:DNA repair exonuclease SbcCD ATPase subunit
MPQLPPCSLLEAATRLEEELRRYEGLADEVSRGAIHSRKSLVRASRIMQDAADCHERMMQHVAALSQAMSETRARQQACAEKLVAAGGRVQERVTVLQSLLAQFDALGELSRSLNEHAAGIATSKEAPVGDALESSAQLLTRMQDAIEQATALADAARAAAFEDLTRDVDSVKQTLQSARNQLLLARRAFTERAPS